jgi:transcriptional regulator with XRE-family HTH domain
MPRRPQDKTFLLKLGAQIREVRLDLGLSQEELGFRVGTDRSEIQKIEAGKTEPLVGTLLRIALALEVEPGDILGGEVWEWILATSKADAAERERPLKGRKRA